MRRLESRRQVETRQARRYGLISKARSSVLGVIVLLCVLAEKETLTTKLIVLGVPAVLLQSLVLWRNRVSLAWRRATRGAEFYAHRLDCLEQRWPGTGEPGLRFLDGAHPYSRDLDLFGTGCLFELLCTSRTSMGEETLADWLRSPAGLEEVHARHAAVAELRTRLDLREELSLLGSVLPKSLDWGEFIAWSQHKPILNSAGNRLAAVVLMVLAIAAFGGCLWGVAPLLFGLVLAVETGFGLSLRREIRKVIGPVELIGPELTRLAGFLERLEREQFASPRLGRLHATLALGGQWSARRIAELARLVSLMPPAYVLLWIPPLAFQIEAWRKACGPYVAGWLTSIGEFEALCALATYAFENPADPFPELTADGPCFEAVELKHPLLPRDRCVANDVRLAGDLRVLIVSGSNMSGKSTLLRTVGVNAVLALAGAPVRARRLRLSPLAVGATLRIQDSLQAGQSRFFVEITRLRQLVEIGKGPMPLLFLLDEILHGTNSHDRRVGAEAVVRSLVERGAIGLVTTHDLALTHIAELLTPRAANVHFEDQLEDGAIIFDYLMRPGVVQNTNALALMRSIGLEV
jgi:hypothetical protein